jgi:hypothetical protein
MPETNYTKLRSIDCSDKVEKKGNLTYLSWAWAVDKLLLADPAANWEHGTPVMFGETMMVTCSVTCFGLTRTAHLPVMDNRNKAISSPDAFQVNTAMQRCLVKAIALHGLGLYIYAGEDIPDGQKTEAEENAGKFLAALKKDDYAGTTEEEVEANRAAALLEVHRSLPDEEKYQAAWKLLDAPTRAAIKKYLAMAHKEQKAA